MGHAQGVLHGHGFDGAGAGAADVVSVAAVRNDMRVPGKVPRPPRPTSPAGSGGGVHVVSPLRDSAMETSWRWTLSRSRDSLAAWKAFASTACQEASARWTKSLSVEMRASRSRR